MPLFNLFSPNLVDFTSESENGERRDVYEGTSKSTMINIITALQFHLQIAIEIVKVVKMDCF